MKQKVNARQKRDAEALRRKEAFSPRPAQSVKPAQEKPAPLKPAVRKEPLPARSPEEEAREFLEYLDKYAVPSSKEDPPQPPRRKSGTSAGIPQLDLEQGMPTVEEALSRMRLGLQEMRYSRVKVVRLIHGYGSTGRGGKIRIGVRSELAAMKRRGQIRDFIPGEDFGPLSEASRRLTETDKTVTHDPHYGRMNPGITVVVL